MEECRAPFKKRLNHIAPESGAAGQYRSYTIAHSTQLVILGKIAQGWAIFAIRFKSQPDSQVAKTHLREGIHSALGDRCPFADVKANISTLVAGRGRGPAGSDLGIKWFQRPRSRRFGGISAALVSKSQMKFRLRCWEKAFVYGLEEERSQNRTCGRIGHEYATDVGHDAGCGDYSCESRSGHVVGRDNGRPP